MDISALVEKLGDIRRSAIRGGFRCEASKPISSGNGTGAHHTVFAIIPPNRGRGGGTPYTATSAGSNRSYSRFTTT